MRLAAAVLLVLLVACGGGVTDLEGDNGTFEGLITEISDESVRVESPDGAEVRFSHEQEAGIVEHLRADHMKGKPPEEPVIVTWERRDGEQFALQIDDVPASPSPGASASTPSPEPGEPASTPSPASSPGSP